MDATKAPKAVRTAWALTLHDGRPVGESGPFDMPFEIYFAGVPSRFRDPETYVVDRAVALSLDRREGGNSIRVRDRADGALVWRSDPKEAP